MIETLTTLVPLSVLMNVGFALSALAFLLRDILHLRLIAVLGYLVFSVTALMRGPDAMLQLLPWYAVFMAINGGHALRLIYERRLQRMSADEAALFDVAFPSLDRTLARRLMRRGRWVDAAVGDTLVTAGESSPCVYIILRGRVRVSCAGRLICYLGPGQFVGEIGFVAKRPAGASAQVVADDEGGGARLLAWDSATTRARMSRDPALHAVMYSALGADLAEKIARHNINVSRRGDDVATAPIAA